MNKLTLGIIMAAVLIIANTVCFMLMYIDKKCARAKARRIPERTLFLSCALFGGLGGVIAMDGLRHKTKHWNFRVYFPVMLGVQFVIICAIAFFVFLR
ncbi:MAG: DUF1294 domain-containing protein [Eubacteriales bacterium]|nr:DUF1294 domain-containing protein [Eubacteriales bacterium]MDD3880984.1 DUF1294 domain-containing protein [Eubacteriales bacterium]MDD4511947.1 DUF1294 domain-containing protein [Eubacteriales bacterium]